MSEMFEQIRAQSICLYLFGRMVQLNRAESRVTVLAEFPSGLGPQKCRTVESLDENITHAANVRLAASNLRCLTGCHAPRGLRAYVPSHQG